MSLLGPSSSAPLITPTVDDGPLAYGAPDPLLNVFNSGLLPEPTHRNPTSSYYLSAGQPISEDLISPVNILSADLSKTAGITVDSANGSMALSPGANPIAGAPPRYGMNLESGASGVIVSIGDSTIPTTPTLQLKGQMFGNPITGEVYDSVFNTPPPAIQVGPTITNNFIVNSPAAGTLLGVGATPNFTTTKVGWYIFQLDIFIPANNQVSFPAGGGVQLRISDVGETQTYGGVSFTSSEIFGNYNAMFPPFVSEICHFSFNNMVYLGAGNYKIKLNTYGGGSSFIFGPNMDSATYPSNFQFTLNYLQSV